MNKILESVASLIKEERGIRKKILDGEDVLKNTERLIAVEAIISAIENRLLVKDKVKYREKGIKLYPVIDAR